MLRGGTVGPDVFHQEVEIQNRLLPYIQIPLPARLEHCYGFNLQGEGCIGAPAGHHEGRPRLRDPFCPVAQAEKVPGCSTLRAYAGTPTVEQPRLRG